MHSWWQRVERGGMEALAAQERTLQRLISDKTPDQLRMPFALWTRAAIGELIRQRCGVRLPVRTIGHYLKRWGFTPQQPLKRAYEQRPEAIARCAPVSGDGGARPARGG